MKPAEAWMMKWIGAAVLALALLLGTAAMAPTVAASPETGAHKAHMRKPAIAGGRRHSRHRVRMHYAYGPYGPHYLDRPYYYAPAPNFALVFGFGFGPWW